LGFATQGVGLLNFILSREWNRHEPNKPKE
jgi:hypothetical protein